VGRQSQVNAAADAAVLVAITPTMMMQQNSTVVATAVKNSFLAQTSGLSNVVIDPTQLTVTIDNSSGKRAVTLSYVGTSKTTFPSALGVTTIPISGNVQATGGLAPNIDFYLLLDTSPSMAIAATQSDINTMVANTSPQGGCGFACHETNPAADNLGNPSKITCVGDTKKNSSFPNGGEDNYALARCLGVTLRIDNLQTAAKNLIVAAQNKEATNYANYRMGFYTFDVNFNTIQSIVPILASTSSSPATSLAASAVNNISMLTVYKNNWLTSSNSNSDADTNYDAAMTGINKVLPNPGSGTTSVGDTPQEVVFFVTDGVEDEMVGSSRQQSLMSPAMCTTIKNRGIRIAVLYTEYLPLPSNSWYNTYISSFQSSIGSNLQSCASAGLYYEVLTGGDISAALTSLFQLAVQSAYLSK
jgi:hypothetical protein